MSNPRLDPISETRFLKRGIYLLPNLLTISGLFAGFYGIVAALKGYFCPAAQAIFIAMIMDGLDGRVARLTNTQSRFGMELDSLSDAISFGVAPALIIYSWSLLTLGKLGWLGAFVFAAAGVLRLARFNTQAAHADKRYFQGLPIPAAAALIASTVWMWYDYTTQNRAFTFVMLALTLVLGLLMVSNIRFYSFKEFHLGNRVPFLGILLAVLTLVCIALNPPLVLLILFATYAGSGPIMTLWTLKQRRRERLRLHANHRQPPQQ